MLLAFRLPPFSINSEHIQNTTVQHQDPVRVVERATRGLSIELVALSPDASL